MTRFAQQYCQARHSAVTERTAQITVLLEDSIRAYTSERNQTVGAVLHRLFLTPDPLNPPSAVLDKFREEAGLKVSKKKFDRCWEEMRDDLADFLLKFVAPYQQPNPLVVLARGQRWIEYLGPKGSEGSVGIEVEPDGRVYTWGMSKR